MVNNPNTLLVQLPLNSSAPLESTGNIPLAGATLAAAAGLQKESILDQETADLYGDSELVSRIVDRSPELIAFTLYSWNVERSIHIAKEVKNHLPDIIIVAGGPEVTPDNKWLLNERDVDLFVSGEGEPVACNVLAPESAATIINAGSGFLEVGQMDFIPGSWPDPWLTGYLDPSDGASVHLETVRGCSSSCSYCSYRRRHPVPRILPAENVIEILDKLSMKGAGEIVFLDPTFNSRPDLIRLLEGMARFQLDCFGEMRGESISTDTAKAISLAGFRSVEIGLQSGNVKALRQAGRMGDPATVLDGALNLKRSGVLPVIDLILGLPGDTPEDAVRTAGIIRNMGLHDHVQVFYLSMLPGTGMTLDAGNRFMSRPPYYRFADINMGGYAAAREEIADIFGYDLDLSPRPLLFEGWPGTECIDLRKSTAISRQIPSFRHGAIVFRSDNPWVDRGRILEFTERRLAADPFCVLDVIIRSDKEFPLDLIDLLLQLDTPCDYSGRVAKVLGRQGNLRTTILLEEWKKWNPEWIETATNICSVAIDVSKPSELPGELWDAGVYIRLPGTGWKIKELSASVPSKHQVLFRNRTMEVRWCREVLGI